MLILLFIKYLSFFAIINVVSLQQKLKGPLFTIGIMKNRLMSAILLSITISARASTVIKCNKPTSVSFCTQACGCYCPPGNDSSISCSINPITCPSSTEETCIETCFCAVDTTPDPTSILCEEPVEASFCEEACGCGCNDVGHINCLAAEGMCTRDAAQLCEAACSCKAVQMRHGVKNEEPSKQVELEPVD